MHLIISHSTTVASTFYRLTPRTSRHFSRWWNMADSTKTLPSNNIYIIFISQTDAEDITPLYKMMERDSAERIAVMNAVRRNVKARSIYRWVLNVLQYWSCSMNHFVFLLMWFSPYIIYKYKKLKFPAIWAKERWQWSCRRLRRSLPNTYTKHIEDNKVEVFQVTFERVFLLNISSKHIGDKRL